MKARVKHNNEIIDVIQVGTKTHLYDLNNVEIIDDPDYWTRLKHTYAGIAMQGLLQSPHLNIMQEEPLIGMASSIAHALVEKMKEERK